MKKWLLATTALALLAGPALAQRSVHTGGEKGAYYGTFCPPIPEALYDKDFKGKNAYRCAISGGTPDNIKKVLAKPTDVALVQLDVFSNMAAKDPSIAQKLTVIRQIACEGVWFVTKNKTIKDYGDVLGRARRIPFIVAAGGSTGTFDNMQKLDPDGLGRARNVSTVDNATAVINKVASSNEGEIGMFVQFADPENANIKLLMDKGLTVVPVVSRELLAAKVDGVDVYQVQSFSLKTGMWAGKDAATTCTPIAIITGNPDSFT